MSATMQQIDTSSVAEKSDWHEQELARRDRLYANGKIPVYDWADAKARLHTRLFGL